MERIELSVLQDALGIGAPWAIKSVVVDAENQRFNIHLDLHDRKKVLGFFDSGRKDSQSLAVGAWQYQTVGNFRCIIHAAIPVASDSGVTSPAVMSLAAFLGHPSRSYSNLIRQQVALAELKGMDVNVMSSVFGLEPSLITTILDDLQKSSVQSRSLAFLPTEVDPSWNKILRDQMLIKTTSLPLKLLLSKMKLTANKVSSEQQRQELVQELRQFFVANTAVLDSEIDQICGISGNTMQQRVKVAKTQQKLVLPALKNPLWLDLLSGKLKLNSQSVPLNLLISRQRMAFLQGHNVREKVQAIETIREYFRKNYRSLKPELVLLNRAMDIRSKTLLRLPEADNEIWQKVLTDDSFVPSDNVAYKLLLAKLRSQLARDDDGGIKIEAATRVREFIKQNQKSMRRELDTLIAKVGAV